MGHVIKFAPLFESLCFRLSEMFVLNVVSGFKNMVKNSYEKRIYRFHFKERGSALRHEGNP